MQTQASRICTPVTTDRMGGPSPTRAYLPREAVVSVEEFVWFVIATLAGSAVGLWLVSVL